MGMYWKYIGASFDGFPKVKTGKIWDSNSNKDHDPLNKMGVLMFVLIEANQ